MIGIHFDVIKLAPNRQRRHFDEDELRKLAASIEKNQLLHPIVVRKEEDGIYLVAGERRLRAMRDYIFSFDQRVRCADRLYEPGVIPCLMLSDLDPLAAEEAELEENIQRVDLSWQERAAATERLMRLRSKQAEAAGLPAPTPPEIAREVRGTAEGRHGDVVRKQIVIANHLSNPEVAKAKTLDDAWKVLKHQEERKRVEELGVRVGRTFSSDAHKLYNEECVRWMEMQDEGQFDVILTDPPYGINAEKFGDGGGRLTTQTHNYDDDGDGWYELIQECAKGWFRLAKPQAHAYVFCDIDRYHTLLSIMMKAGWRVHRTPIIDYKLDGSRVPWPGLGPQRKWEMILYAVKGDRPALFIRPDVIETRGDDNLGHGAQKPVSLYLDLLRRSCNPGDSVLDTFAGTGTIFPAAHELKVSAVGVEMDPVYYGIALERIGKLKTKPLN